MTTVRRLLLELGVVGDLDTKSKLQDVQNSADILKKSLQEVEMQLTTLGRIMTQTPQFGGSGGSGAVLSTEERRNVEGAQSRIREQIAQTQMREQKQLSLSEKTVSLQEQILKAMQLQIQGQRDVIKKQMTDMTADRQMFKNVAENLDTIIGQTIGFVAKAKRPLGIRGRAPKRYEYVYDPVKGVPFPQETEKFRKWMKPNIDLMGQMQQAKQELPVLIKEMQKSTDPKAQQEIWDKLNKLKESVNAAAESLTKFKGIVSKTVETKKLTEDEVRAITKFPLHDIETAKSTKGAVFPIPIDKEHWFLKAQERALQEKTKIQPPVKPFIAAAAIKPQMPTLDDDITEIEQEIARIKQARTAPYRPPVKTKLFTKKAVSPPVSAPSTPSMPTQATSIISKLKGIDPAALASARAAMKGAKPSKDDDKDVHDYIAEILHKMGKESKEALTTPELQRSRVAAKVANEFERADIAEKAKKIREEIEAEVMHDEEIKKRGFVFKPAEKIRERGIELKSKYESWKESIREKATGFVAKQRGFKSAEEYISEREKGRRKEAEAQAAKEKAIVHNFTFEINNPIVDSDERMQTFIRHLTQAFKGMS